jgi:hypothetical protein
MMYWSDGWAWFWMIPMMLLWVLVLGVVVYAAVRLANRNPQQKLTSSSNRARPPNEPPATLP